MPRSPSPIAATALHGTERLFGYTACLLRLAIVLFDVAQDAADVIDREVACEGAKKAPAGILGAGAGLGGKLTGARPPDGPVR